MTTLLDEPLYLIGKIPNNDTIPGENAKPNRFVRISNERAAMNDWEWIEPNGRNVLLPHGSLDTEGVTLDHPRRRLREATLHPHHGTGRLSHITMQCWDHRPTRLYTVMRNLLGKREMPFQIMEMSPASTARFQQFAIAVAEQTGRTEIKEALTALWATPSTTAIEDIVLNVLNPHNIAYQSTQLIARYPAKLRGRDFHRIPDGMRCQISYTDNPQDINIVLGYYEHNRTAMCWLIGKVWPDTNTTYDILDVGFDPAKDAVIARMATPPARRRRCNLGPCSV